MNEIKKAATRDAYGKTLVALGQEDPNIVVLDADLSCSTKTGNFCKAYPARFINAGVAEADMIGMSAGLATTGKTVFCSTFAIFGSGRVWEQIRDSVCYPRLNVKIVVTHAGITTGEDGVTHQAMEDIAIMRVIPNLTVLVPADAIETEKIIREISKLHGPFYVRLSRSETPLIFDRLPNEFQIGKMQQIKAGDDLTLIGCGMMASTALEAAALLEKTGIHARVMNCPSIKPFDTLGVIKCAKETGAIVTCEEHSSIGGLGSAVAEVLAENQPTPMIRVGGKDLFAESGNQKELIEKYGLDAAAIVHAAKIVLGRKQK